MTSNTTASYYKFPTAYLRELIGTVVFLVSLLISIVTCWIIAISYPHGIGDGGFLHIMELMLIAASIIWVWALFFMAIIAIIYTPFTWILTNWTIRKANKIFNINVPYISLVNSWWVSYLYLLFVKNF